MSFGGNDSPMPNASYDSSRAGMFDMTKVNEARLDRAGDLMNTAFTGAWGSKAKGPSYSLISAPEQAPQQMIDTPGKHKSLLGQ